jgi:hypothetical protein
MKKLLDPLAWLSQMYNIFYSSPYQHNFYLYILHLHLDNILHLHLHIVGNCHQWMYLYIYYFYRNIIVHPSLG